MSDVPSIFKRHGIKMIELTIYVITICISTFISVKIGLVVLSKDVEALRDKLSDTFGYVDQRFTDIDKRVTRLEDRSLTK